MGDQKKGKRINLRSIFISPLLYRLPSVLSFFQSTLPPGPLPFLSSISICDPDIHHRRLSSCVLFIPHCVHAMGWMSVLCMLSPGYKHAWFLYMSDRQMKTKVCPAVYTAAFQGIYTPKQVTVHVRAPCVFLAHQQDHPSCQVVCEVVRRWKICSCKVDPNRTPNAERSAIVKDVNAKRFDLLLQNCLLLKMTDKCTQKGRI